MRPDESYCLLFFPPYRSNAIIWFSLLVCHGQRQSKKKQAYNFYIHAINVIHITSRTTTKKKFISNKNAHHAIQNVFTFIYVWKTRQGILWNREWVNFTVNIFNYDLMPFDLFCVFFWFCVCVCVRLCFCFCFKGFGVRFSAKRKYQILNEQFVILESTTHCNISTISCSCSCV